MLGKVLFATFFLLSSQVVAGEELISVDVGFIDYPIFENRYVRLQSVSRLRSSDKRFGGLSALSKTQTGFISLSDRGNLFLFDETLENMRVLPLKNKSGEPLSGKRKTDAESLALVAQDTFYVAFERNHRVRPYGMDGMPLSQKIDLPQAVLDLPENAGFEAIESFRDGRLVLLAEGKKNADETMLLVEGKVEGDWQRRSLPLFDNFRPTGLSRLVGTDRFILLERFYAPLKGNRIRLSLLDAENGKRLALLAELAPPIPVDNFEGISVYQDKDGQIILALISDDNFNFLQRTLLMKLVLK